MRLIALFIFAATLLLASPDLHSAIHPQSAIAGAQSSASPPPSQPTFTAESALVVLHVSVRDRGGRYISGLDRDAFTVIDDGRPQTIELFSGDEVPASIGFLIDNSNSMRPSRDRVIAAAVEFARRSDPRDEIFVLTFNEQVRHAFGPAVAGDTDPAAFRIAMVQAIAAHGMTAIYDGVLAGLRRVSRGLHTRQVLIVVSDGDDNASTATRDDVIRQVRESDAAIYTIALVDPLTREGDPGLLRQLAKATGGESYKPQRPDGVGDAFARIARDIRSAYTIAYAPVARTGAGLQDSHPPRRHTVRVYARSKDGRALQVRTRDGYFEKVRGASG